MVRFGKVAYVIIGKVTGRRAIHPTAAARVLSHGHPELDTSLPDRLIIVRAVQGDRIAVPGGLLPIDTFRRARNRSLLVSPHHDCSKATLSDRVVEFLERFVGILARDNSNRRKPR